MNAARPPRPRRTPPRPGERVTLLAVGRSIAAVVCPLCAALVIADGEAAHARTPTTGVDR